MKHAQSRARNQEIARKGHEGASVASLSEEYGLTTNYIYALLRKHGVAPAHIPRGERQLSPKKVRISKRRAVIAELHTLGISGGEAIRAMKLHKSVFYVEARRLGLKFPYDSGRWKVGGRNSQQRAAKMAAMYRAGMTLQQIGDKFGITRERVRQLMSKHEGMDYNGGGQHIKAVAKRQQSKAIKDARYLSKYGCTFAQYQEVRNIGRQMVRDGFGKYRTPLSAFRSQRNNAKFRGIEWSLSFWQWWTLWQESGKWSERGLRRDGYVMSRFMDKGDYSLGNVYIGTLAENSSVQPNNPYRKDHPDHARMLPIISEKLRAAKRGGAFAARGTASRRKKDKDLPCGVARTGSGSFRANAFLNGKNTYLGTFASVDKAHAAYLRATGQEVNTAHKISEAA